MLETFCYLLALCGWMLLLRYKLRISAGLFLGAMVSLLLGLWFPTLNIPIGYVADNIFLTIVIATSVYRVNAIRPSKKSRKTQG